VKRRKVFNLVLFNKKLMKEALYWKKFDDKIKCELCPKFCVVEDNEIGNCGVRKNIKGKLYSLVYGKPASVAIDAIEKKPLYHFLPGSLTYSIGTVGCNLHCSYCQNWEISQAKFENVRHTDLIPEKVVENAILNNCKSIAYTYSEPIIFLEYVLDTAKIAKKNGLRNVIVSNGFINEEPLKELCKVIDAANIDLKGFSDGFYRKYTNSWLDPVLNSLKILKNKKVWLEITNLVIPGKNDNIKEVEEMCKWIKEELGEVPLHFSKFYPWYRMGNEKETPLETLERNYKIGKEYLKYVYIGNVITDKENTYCGGCGKLLIKRKGFDVVENNIKRGRCVCEEKIIGVWE